MALSTCRHCTRFYVTEDKKRLRCPECRRPLSPATPEEWQQAKPPRQSAAPRPRR